MTRESIAVDIYTKITSKLKLLYRKSWYLSTRYNSNVWLCFFFYFLFLLHEWHVFFFLFWVTFRWINIGSFIIILDWFTPEWFLPPCLFVRNKDYVEKSTCLSHFCFLVEISLPHYSCIIISRSSKFFFIFRNNFDRCRPLWNK